MNAPILHMCSGAALCMHEVKNVARVIGGPTLYLCEEHTARMIEAAKESGVAARIEIALVDAPTGGPT
jgi:hypothetical protein